MKAGPTNLREMTLALLAARSSGATICPSEVARAAAAGAGRDQAVERDWREIMPAVHAAVDRLQSEGLVRLSWKGVPLAARAGPYRISRSGG